MTTPHVVIVGAGIGGLCLAQGLTKAGVDVELHERDHSAAFRHQGYRISLKDTGVRALRACLPTPLFDLCAATAIRPATRMIFMSESLTPHLDRPTHSAGGPGFDVNRLTLREVLLAGLDDRVRFDSTFERFESTGDGQVRAHFADGDSTVADLLVGADGTWSAVRRQLVPDAVVDELGWSVYGRTPLTPDLLHDTPDVLVDTFNRVSAPEGTGFAVATCRTSEPQAHAVARLAPSVRLTDIPGYFSWTLGGVPDHYRDADSATLHRAAADVVASWHPAVGRIIARADVAATFAVTITSAQPVRPWHHAGVTLLGDAVHTMSPGRGEGANIALRDARTLCDTVVHGMPKATYETDMLRYGFQAVADSRTRPFGSPRVHRSRS
jgi:2-polyprenyl-6-methoxyphenol hydroxylase-like FAD-dependent oxidoreductase